MSKIILRYGTCLRIYDNGGKTADRYTVLPPRWAGEKWRTRSNLWAGIGASSRPFHPQGFGMHITASAGSHLGKRIAWNALPGDVQKFARQTFGAWVPL